MHARIFASIIIRNSQAIFPEGPCVTSAVLLFHNDLSQELACEFCTVIYATIQACIYNLLIIVQRKWISIGLRKCLQNSVIRALAFVSARTKFSKTLTTCIITYSIFWPIISSMVCNTIAHFSSKPFLYAIYIYIYIYIYIPFRQTFSIPRKIYLFLG